MIINDTRPQQYRYWDQLVDHLEGNTNRVFDGTLVYPRQFELHLPSNHYKPCNLACPHCAGKLFDKTLGTWEMDGLELLDKLQGKIPYHIYGGAYTEPLMNPYMMTYLHMTKKYGNHFGIHTNGTMLKTLEQSCGWITELNRIATDDVDYLSISVDAGNPWTWGKTKGTTHMEMFHDIIAGVQLAIEARKRCKRTHAIRLCYLISPHSGEIGDFMNIIGIAKSLQVDSLRFSIPFGSYNQTFDTIRQYRDAVETPGDAVYRKLLAPYLSASQNDVPYIFYTGPEFTDIDRFTFDKCAYGYYQITYGADGYVYKCSTTATPTAPQCRLGKVTADVDQFNDMILKNYNPHWSCQKSCFARGVRCNRMAMEINTMLESIHAKEA